MQPPDNQSPTGNKAKAASSSVSPRPRWKKAASFPIKLYAMLELAENISEFAQAASWLPHGRAFKIHNKTKFMTEVVPIFFNQTKMRSFNRQLYLWEFCPIGRGDNQIWFHKNFLRGKPECIKNIIRTKIKGTAAVGEVVRVPNFDELPPLPICDKLPSAILDVMENAIMKMPRRFSGATEPRPCAAAMLKVPSLPAINDMSTVSGPETCDFNVNCYSAEEFPTMYPYPSSFSQRVSQNGRPAMQYHLPLQVNSTESLQPMSMSQSSLQNPYYLEQQSHVYPYNGRAHSSQLNHNGRDFEPFTCYNEPCDDFATFIQDAIHLC